MSRPPLKETSSPDMNNVGTVSVTPSQLKTFLTEAPLMYKSKLDKKAEKHILTNCYRALWSNDLNLMQKYFFKEGLSDSDNLSQLLEKYNLFGSADDNDEHLQNLHNEDDEPEYWESQRGKQCGHLFKKGESVYRCRNCGLDDTCVMCSKCFHAMNHEGHDVKIWISRGAGGCCDCGDPEAWKVPLECGIHSLQTTADISENTSATANQRQLEPLSSVPPNIFHSVKETITVVLDYILETFAASPEDVVSVGTVESIQQDCIDSHESLGLPVNQKNQKYACILWNDEKHSFDEVISTVMKALNCSKEEAAYAAECVDLYGRHIIKESANIAELVRIAEVISDINLAVTICSSEKTVREEIAGLLLDWLKELTGGRYKFFNNVNGGNCIIRDILCEVLSTDWALRPELAWLSIRYRRGRMPENEDDPFDHDETDADMDDEGDVEDMMFGDDVEEIDEEDILLDEDQIDDLFQRFGAEVEDEEDSDETFEDAEELPSISVQQNNETEAIDMDTDQPTQTTRPLFTSSTSNESLSRRRQSDVQPPHNEAGSSNLESQGRAAEVLKRRRLSASSQPKSSKTHKSRDILDMDWSLEAWLEYTEKLELEEKAITQQLGIPPESTATSTNDTLAETRLINANLKKEFKRKLRIDYLLLFDLRLWKTARISIKDLLIGTLISNFDYRPILGTRFARNYPDLVDAFFFKDREPENSVSTLSVQLLTVPTVASMLVKDYKFFGIVCSILENFFLTDHVHMLLPEEFQRAQVDCSSKAIGRHRYAYTIFDLRYVMNAEQVKAEISKNPVYLRQFLDMLFQFQEMDAIKRKADAHVEFESQSWVTAFNMTLQISKLCRLFAECFNSPAEVAVADASRNLCRSIYRVLKAISEWTHIIESHKNRDTVENISEDDESSPVQTTTPRTRFFFSVRESRDNKEARVKIAGVGEQSFHQISTPTAGTFSIVDYDITTKPVSFHHPFHWLLSELFENVSLLHQGILNELGWLGGFKQMVSDAFQSKDHDMFLLVLEYPIRTIAMLSQISCGVWVRNGYNIRNQAHSYKDVDVRENTLDCDIYLLQVGLVVCDSNQILLTLMDRFQLVDWFRGKPGKCKNYDASQTVYMVEDFLNLLIICATEHGYASDVSTEQRIRQSIIQYLGIGSMSYSELLKLIPESISDHESFETQLNMIANYKAPDGLSDKGLYEIKSEYLDEIEPYHWHYTRNQREEAQHVLKKRWNQLNPDNKVDDKEEYLVIPKIKRIEIGPFRHLGKFLHSHLICQIIAYALWDAKFHKASKSDTILDEALYLAMLAVTDPNSSASELAAMKVEGRFRADVLIDESNTKHFVDFAEADEYSIQINEIEKTHASLLVILLRCLDDPELAHAHKRLGFIVDKIEYYGSDVAKERIAEYKERKARETKAELERTGGSGESEYERKRAAAKARQAAIMSQFANAQSKFMEQHADLYKTEEDEDIREAYEDTATGANDISSEDDVEIIRKCHFPADNCIVCQEELDDSKLFGMLGLIQQANTQRLAPLDNKDVLAEVLETSNSANPWVPKDESNTDKLPPFSGFPTDAHLSGLDISSCGHLMHSECFDNYQQSVDTHLLGELGRMFPLAIPPKSRFLCPLCKALGNVLVPIVWKGKKESYPGVMAPSTPYADLTRVVKDAADILKKSFEQIPGSFDEEQPFVNTDPDLVISDQEKLKHIYNQLMKVIHATWDKKSIERASNLADSIRALYDMYSYTITDFEIAQRGTEGTRARDLTVEHTGTFIDDIPNTSQTLLKVLGLTNTLIQKLMNSPWQAEDRFTQERLALQAINQFIPNTVSHLVEDMVEADTLKPLLVDDPFKALVRLSFSVAECPSIEAHHLLRSIYLAELSKTVVALASSFLNDDKLLKDNKISQLLQSLNLDQQQSSEAEAVQQFATYVLGLTMPQASIDRFFHCVHPGALTALIRTFALPFLRKSLLFMVVHHGFILQDPSNDMQEKNEFDNLLDILRLPSLNNLFELQTFEQEMIGGWCKDYLKYSPTEYQTSPNNDPVSISLNLPTRFRMTTLPYRLDQLLDESLKRVCKNCKTVPEHSAICLICGTFVCARRFCCTKGNKGECNTHMKHCSGEIGIYLMIKDCFLLLLHDNGGSIMNAPYLDSHGEADIFLKRGAPQYLNVKRYEQIRQMWLNQSIPAFVRRRMETAYSATVWEAF